MQLQMVKIMKIKASWGPLKFKGPREVSPVPPPLGGPEHVPHKALYVGVSAPTKSYNNSSFIQAFMIV